VTISSQLVAQPAPRPDPRPDPLSGFAALLPVRHDWWDQAACRDPDGSLSRLFFSDELHDIARAKTICAACPVLTPCLEGALERREPWGVWGGQLFLNGRILASKRRRGRPPKIPRPDDQLPQVPIPEHLQVSATA
jgi:WhiB family transcriptional regulator, redox-sensing transcriptional regulator